MVAKAAKKAAKNTKWYINIIIMFLIYFIVSMIPPVGGITEMGMKVVALTLALLWGWITVDLLWPSVFGFILLQFTGYTTITEGLAAGIGNSTVMMTIILLAFAVSLSLMGVSDIIAAWVISRKMFIGHPVILVFGLLFGTIRPVHTLPKNANLLVGSRSLSGSNPDASDSINVNIWKPVLEKNHIGQVRTGRQTV